MSKAMITALIVGAANCVPGISHSASVDFLGGSLVSLETVPGEFAGQTFTQGTWREDGIDVEWLSYNDLLIDYGIDPTEITPPTYTNLSDSNPGADPFVTQNMVITRTGGSAFDLERIGSSSTYEGILLFGQFDPEDPLASVETVEFPQLGPSITLTGLKANSATVIFEGTTKSVANFLPGVFGSSGLPQFSALDVILPADVKALFTDLTSLTLEIDGYPRTGSLPEAFLESYTELGAPDVFLTGLSACGASLSCSVPGLGEFFFFDGIGGRNDTRNVTISDFELSFSDTPAPVPLPASALLLLAGLGALSVASRKRR